jgi:hypothetical protein
VKYLVTCHRYSSSSGTVRSNGNSGSHGSCCQRFATSPIGTGTSNSRKPVASPLHRDRDPQFTRSPRVSPDRGVDPAPDPLAGRAHRAAGTPPLRSGHSCIGRGAADAVVLGHLSSQHPPRGAPIRTSPRHLQAFLDWFIFRFNGGAPRWGRSNPQGIASGIPRSMAHDMLYSWSQPARTKAVDQPGAEAADPVSKAALVAGRDAAKSNPAPRGEDLARHRRHRQGQTSARNRRRRTSPTGAAGIEGGHRGKAQSAGDFGPS